MVTLLITLASATACAQRIDAAGGDGRQNCGESADRSKAGHLQGGIQAAWVDGLLGGYNIHGSRPQIDVVPSTAEIVAFLDQCSVALNCTTPSCKPA